MALGALFLAICALPMLVIALAIKLTSKGPVFFRQLRHGEDGVEFHVLKFRSMTTMDNGADVAQAQRFDPRVTKVGAILRRSSLDELPQFLNVLAGEMSVVGPRPHAVAHNVLYRAKIREYMRRHKVKPGITGWAQVRHCYVATVDDTVKKLEYDIYYVKNNSLLLDLLILLETVRVVLLGEGAR
jgi:putative colanic acid biosynthesis UDP-glucose lipid carrier transferase